MAAAWKIYFTKSEKKKKKSASYRTSNIIYEVWSPWGLQAYIQLYKIPFQQHQYYLNKVINRLVGLLLVVATSYIYGTEK